MGVSAFELYTRGEAMRRLVWGRKAWTAAQRAGLKTFRLGRIVYVRGAAILDLAARLEAQQNGEGKAESGERKAEGAVDA
jgi:hypothetical protein